MSYRIILLSAFESSAVIGSDDLVEASLIRRSLPSKTVWPLSTERSSQSRKQQSRCHLWLVSAQTGIV
jgi:hypothetical protein